MASWVVIGGGFKGIITAAILKHAGHQVTLIEPGKSLGGVMRGMPYQGFWLDLGCHLFDNSDSEITRLLFDILEGDVSPVRVEYAGFMSGGRYKGFTVPHLASTDIDQKSLLWELWQTVLNCNQDEAGNYEQYLINRYGTLAATYLVDAAQKKVAFDPSKLAPCAKDIILFDRVGCFDNNLAMELKSHPELDGKIAAGCPRDAMAFYPDAKVHYEWRNFYPANKGMQGFSEHAFTYLETIGVQVLLNTQIVEIGSDRVVTQDATLLSDEMVWSLDLALFEKLWMGTNALQEKLHEVPMVLFYFFPRKEQCTDITYVHDHRQETLIFRSANAGTYSHQIIDGRTYISCEVPCSKESPIWLSPEKFSEQIWSEATEHGVVKGEMPEFHYVKAPVTFKLPLVGYENIHASVMQKAKAQFSSVQFVEDSLFARQSIVNSVQKWAEEQII